MSGLCRLATGNLQPVKEGLGAWQLEVSFYGHIFQFIISLTVEQLSSLIHCHLILDFIL